MKIWLEDAFVQLRFDSMVWMPLCDMINDVATTTAFVAAMKVRNPANWPALRARLNALNLGFDGPTISSVAAPLFLTLSQQVLLIGTGFAPGMIVWFGATQSPMVIVNSASEAFAEVPPKSGSDTVDVTITVSGVGSDSLPNAFTYVY
jgi:hypothetical protein